MTAVAFSLGLAALASLLLALLPGRIGFLPPLLIPVVVSAFPLAFNGRRFARFARIAATVLLFAFAGVSMASIGLFYIPSLLAMMIAAARK